MDAKEKCGIIGFLGEDDEIYTKVFLLMSALQHRGQEGCGIAFWNSESFYNFKTLGLVADLFKKTPKEGFKNVKSLIGHIRYSTTGSNDLTNVQPFISKTIDGKNLALAHNGNIVNAINIRIELMKEGHTFNTTTDSEVILHLIVKEYNKGNSIESSIIKSLSLLEGSFSLVILFDDKLIIARDKNGFRPLCYSTVGKNVFVASEDTALRSIDVFEYEEVKPGEVIVFSASSMKRIHYPKSNGTLSHCIFELVYFAKPSSNLFGEGVYNFRYFSGKYLGEKDKHLIADYVVPVPDSGLISALGYSETTGIPLGFGLIRSHFVGRSFIQPEQSMRESVVKTKFFVPLEIVKDKKIVLIDDSIVRGTTMKKIVMLLRKHGAKEIHLRVASPPVKYPCFFGIDFPKREDLIANRMSIEEIRKFLNVDSLRYLEFEDMMRIVRKPSDFCTACFSGNYKIRIYQEISKEIFENKNT